ncbi:MAG: hypothetical protein WCO88_07125 [Actinomycetota bacterium]
MGLFKKKPTVDPVDVLVLHNEIAALKERLDAAEQAKAQLHDQMSALAATTMVLSSNNQTDTTDLVEQLEGIERRLNATEAVGPRLEALARRVVEVESRPAGTVSGDAPTDIAELAARLEQVAQLAASPAQPDDELAARLIQLERNATTVEALNRQIVVLAASVSSQQGVTEQLAELSERVNHLGELSERVDQLGELSERVDQVAELAAQPAQALVAPTPPPAEPDFELAARIATLEANAEQIDALTSQLAALTDRVDIHGNVRDQLVAITERVEEMSRQGIDTRQLQLDLGELVASSTLNRELSDELAQLRDLAERVTATEDDSRRTRDQVNLLDQRLAQMATELTNQLGELSGEIDQLATRPMAVAAPAVDDAAVDALRSGQVKLASEQARFEIGFREDLARLAEDLHRLKSRN